MYGFGLILQRPHLCALALLQGLTCGVTVGRSQTVETIRVVQDVSVKTDVFSPRWLKQYTKAAPECTLGRGSYTWRECGLGSNINNMLNSWVYYLAVEDWNDISLICDDNQFQSMNCFHASGGLVSHGWGCLFSSMPHMCVFDTAEAWTNHSISANVSDEDLHTAAGCTFEEIRSSKSRIVNSLQDLNIDHLGALSVMAKYLWSYMTPWVRNDVNFVIHTQKVVEGLPFLGMHVRRGDKLADEAKATDVKEYLKAAVTYLDDETTSTGVDGIKAIWVASDTPEIADEVRTLAPAYFPNVPMETIVYVGHGLEGSSFSTVQDYGSFVSFLADLEKLAAAELFVGTFSSNVARLVVLFRESLGKPRTSSISLDDPSWYPARQRSLQVD